MKRLWHKLRAWYLRRFRGFVRAPGGTSWQQHAKNEVGFTCRCGQALAFTNADLFIRERDHVMDCSFQFAAIEPVPSEACACPITDARYCKVCPNPACRLGHWKQAV